MTYSYVYHLRNLRQANLLRTQQINFSMRPQHVRMTRDPTSFEVSFLENPCEYRRKLYIARNWSPWSTWQLLQYWSICIYFNAIVFESQEKVFKTSINARPHCPLTSPFQRTRPNIRTNFILPETRACRRFAPLTVCLSLLVFTQLFSEVARSQPAKPARKQNLTRNSHNSSAPMLCNRHSDTLRFAIATSLLL